ncbi:T6SS effector BTH_I2691 family protein [Acinetobacter bereziniae]|uniref:T6SS effector BTH_I2691 family protein n=1 Tax=Acinetobacter bereziniae TaxID=106648 RepID=UPI0025847C2D|nr:T6SS effector BTH_I2691 family protein [uncultured Acinetobacter sp.]
MANNKGCNVCDKQGLPVYVSRFGFSSNISSVKPSLAIPKNYPKLSGSGMNYEVTSIRKTGYIYVFDELDNSFYYFVKDRFGTFARKTIGTFLNVETTTRMHEPCKKDAQKLMNGMFITIPKANVSRKIWLAYSAHLWTSRIIQLHKNSAYRAAHMSSVIVGQPKGEFHCPITELSKVKNTNFNSIVTQSMINESERLAKGKGIIVALHDPVALMIDIQVAIEEKGAKFVHQDDVKRAFFSDVTLSALQAGIPQSLTKQSIENREIELKRMQQAQNQRQAKYGFDPVQMSEKKFDEQRQKELQGSIESEWAKYTKKFNPAQRKAKIAEIKNSQKAYDQKHIYPLAIMIKQWIYFEKTISYFKCQFDSKNIASGVCYAHEATLALGGSCALDPVRIELAKKLKAQKFSDDNFVLNALSLNFDVIKKKIIESFSKLKPAVENPFRDIPWDALFSAFSDSLDKNVQNATGINLDKLGASIALTFGPLFNMLCQGLLKVSQGGVAVLSMAMMYNLKLRVLNVRGVRTQKVARAVAGRMISLSLQQGGSSTAYLQRHRAALEVQLKYRIDDLVNETGLSKAQLKRELVVVESIFKKGVSVSDFAKSLESETSVQKWNDDWKTTMQNRVSSVGASVKSSFAIGSSALVGAFQGWVLTKLYDDAFGDTTMKNDETENMIRFGLGVSAVGAAIATTIEKCLGAYRTPSANIVTLQRNVGLVAKLLGGIAGFGVAIMDGYAGYNAYQENNNALAGLYFSSFIIGTGLTYLALSSISIPMLGWMIAIGAGLMILISIGISKLKDNALQDWVERCSFGTLIKQRYTTYNLMQSEFEKAMKAIAK